MIPGSSCSGQQHCARCLGAVLGSSSSSDVVGRTFSTCASCRGVSHDAEEQPVRAPLAPFWAGSCWQSTLAWGCAWQGYAESLFPWNTWLLGTLELCVHVTLLADTCNSNELFDFCLNLGTEFTCLWVESLKTCRPDVFICPPGLARETRVGRCTLVPAPHTVPSCMCVQLVSVIVGYTSGTLGW